ncbi:MAG: hypothetical protein ACK2UM_04320 [Anaerolineales bacterium]
MTFNKSYLGITMFFTALLFARCTSSVTPSDPQQPGELKVTTTSTAAKIPLSTLTPSLVPSLSPQPTATPVPTQKASPTPTQAILSKIVRRMCPDLRSPVGLFSTTGPIYDESTNPATVYVPYQVEELRLDPSDASCSFYLSPPPMGNPQFAGDFLFWMSFDPDSEWVMVWKYDLNAGQLEDGFPQNSFLRQTRTNTSIGKAGLFDFVVAEDGETLVWSYTEPNPYDVDEMGYFQTMYGADTSGPIDQRPAVDIWNDFVPEGDSGGRIIRPIRSDGERVYFSQEPVGLGTQWPEPRGRYTNLYSIQTWGYDSPDLHFDCGGEHWCITDFSDDQGILVSIQEELLRIVDLTSAELIREVQALVDYPLVRQAMIGPDGSIAFLGFRMDHAGNGEPPVDAALFLIDPPYLDDPVMVLDNAGLLNLIGWAAPHLVLVDGNNPAIMENNNSTLPQTLMLVDIEKGEGTWLEYDVSQFITLVD